MTWRKLRGGLVPRSKLHGPEDLPNVQDGELITAANTMGLVSDIGTSSSISCDT